MLLRYVADSIVLASESTAMLFSACSHVVDPCALSSISKLRTVPAIFRRGGADFQLPSDRGDVRTCSIGRQSMFNSARLVRPRPSCVMPEGRSLTIVSVVYLSEASRSFRLVLWTPFKYRPRAAATVRPDHPSANDRPGSAADRHQPGVRPEGPRSTTVISFASRAPDCSHVSRSVYVPKLIGRPAVIRLYLAC